MLSRRTVAILALAAGTLFNADSSAQDLDRLKSKTEVPRVTRVFFLNGMDTREAVTLLRSEVQVRRIAHIDDLSAIVVSDVAEKVERSESLLREKDVLARSSDPHEPIDVKRTLESPVTTRLFQIQGTDARGAVTVLRAIYAMGGLKVQDDGNVRVRAKLPKLEAAEALLRELGVLAKVTQPDDGTSR